MIDDKLFSFNYFNVNILNNWKRSLLVVRVKPSFPSTNKGDTIKDGYNDK
jgi:hypothetical protein